MPPALDPIRQALPVGKCDSGGFGPQPTLSPPTGRTYSTHCVEAVDARLAVGHAADKKAVKERLDQLEKEHRTFFVPLKSDYGGTASERGPSGGGSYPRVSWNSGWSGG